MISRSLLVVAALAGAAHADPLAELFAKYSTHDYRAPKGTPDPRFVLGHANLIAPELAVAIGSWSDGAPADPHAIVGWSADRSAAWVGESVSYNNGAGPGHGLALFDKDQHAIAWTWTRNPSAKLVAANKGKGIEEIATTLEPGTEVVVKLLELAIAEPATFAKLISPRADAVMFGSDNGERFVGGAAIAKTLAAWKLGFVVRGGTVAALSTSKTAAVIGMVVDAVRPGTKGATAYRMLAILDKAGASWQIVALSFDAALE